MSKIAEMRQKRGELWDKAKAFLNEHADENGMMNAEDTATYERMEKDIDSFGAAIDREERAERLEHELNAPTSQMLSSRPEKPLTDKPGRTSDEYRSNFWTMVRDRYAHYTVFNALQVVRTARVAISFLTSMSALWYRLCRKKTSSVPCAR